ncbi:MAG: 50S ribosomal protein L32e [Desulfurococcales archaeon ex4484_217_2]|nr:MAG: 50S ribosomal protein L32e [Desulfurococcales archaeon ex4484_217_2]
MSESEFKRLLKLRNLMNRKRPRFLRHLWWKFAKFDEVWRKPRGIDNKMRQKLKGYPPVVSVGYRGPKLVRELHPTGRRIVIVHNVKELEKVDKEKDIVYIASTVGRRKRAEILEKAKQLGVKVANP